MPKALAILLFFQWIAGAQSPEISSTLLNPLRFRNIGPVGNRVIAAASVPGDPNIYYTGASRGVFNPPTAACIGRRSSTRVIVPRRTLAHRMAKHQPLSREESDEAVRVARITTKAEQVFGEPERAWRWLREPKRRFGGKRPIEMLATDAGARLPVLREFHHRIVDAQDARNVGDCQADVLPSAEDVLTHPDRADRFIQVASHRL